ncbi:hypothetical protein BJX62DRAFT_223567 [Aspergillus germanicus]
MSPGTQDQTTYGYDLEHTDYYRLDSHANTPSIIAIHGLQTTSEGTWVYRHPPNPNGAEQPMDTAKETNWLTDSDMLPNDVPTAHIYTYNWSGNFLGNDSMNEPLRGHAATFMTALGAELGKRPKVPIIFIASCFGGLLLAKALLSEDPQHGPQGDILKQTVGIAFLATPFKGTAAARFAKWAAFGAGLMGKESSPSLVTVLRATNDQLTELRTHFETLVMKPTPMPVVCYYEQQKTQMARRVRPKILGRLIAPFFGRVMLVEKDSATLGGHLAIGRKVPHVLMNKFSGPDANDYRVIRDIIKGFVADTHTVIYRRSDSPRIIHVVMPYEQNDEFVGRKNQLTELARLIHPDSSPDHCQVNVIVGLYGKVDRDLSLFWVRADSEKSLETDYEHIRDRLGMVFQPSSMVRQVNVELNQRPGRWLLIFDGVDENETFFQNWRQNAWFTNKAGSIARIIDLSFLDEEEARELLMRDLRSTDALIDSRGEDADIDELISLLAGLPLAIKLASQYIGGTNRLCESPSGQQRRSSPLSRRAVAATWLITLKKIKEANAGSYERMKFIAQCGDKNIPISMIQTQTGVEAHDAIGDLMAYSLVRRPEHGADRIDVHPLVQLAMKIWLSEIGQGNQTTTGTLEELKLSFPTRENLHVWKTQISHVEKILAQHNNEDTRYVGAVWRVLYLSEATTLHQRAMRMEVLKPASVSAPTEAEVQYNEALKQESDALHNVDPTVTEQEKHLACTLLLQGKCDPAIERYRRVLSKEEDMLGKGHPCTLATRRSLGLALKATGDLTGAVAQFEALRPVEKETLDNATATDIRNMDELAILYQQQGRIQHPSTQASQSLWKLAHERGSSLL